MNCFTRANPYPTCYGWNPDMESICTHEKYVCPTYGRKQCRLLWPYPMKTEEEAIYFLKSAELRTCKTCFVRHVQRGTFEKWKIFTGEKECKCYLETRKHRR